MARATYVIRDGQLVEKHLARPLHESSDAPFVQSDSMEAIKSMADGKTYDSKSRYRRELRAHGCIEVGNERAPYNRPPTWEPSGVGESIKQAYEQLERRR